MGALINQNPVCVDDYGDEIYRCHWSERLVAASEALLTGSFLPGSSWKYVAAPGFEEYRKASYMAFADSERNCNTCRHLERIPHKKDTGGFLFGICKSESVEHPYPVGSNGEIMFPPDDCMNMPCYVSRWDTATV